METSPTVNRTDLYERYEAALVGLIGVPQRLQSELSTAKKAIDVATTAASAEATKEEERLAKLRRTITSRYGESAKALQSKNVLMPAHIRSAAGQNGDAGSVAAAINAQQESERAVAIELQAAANAAIKQGVEDKARAAAGRDAAEALRRRQEQVRQARAEAEAEAERLAEADRTKRSQQVLIGVGVVALVLIVIVLALLIS